MRFYIIFGITFILCAYLIFFDPFAKYLGIYKNDIIIEQEVFQDGYHWECESDSNFKAEKLSDNKWKFDPKKSGDASVVFNFVNDEDPTDIKYTVNYEFKIVLNQIFWSVGEALGLTDFPNPY